MRISRAALFAAHIVCYSKSHTKWEFVRAQQPEQPIKTPRASRAPKKDSAPAYRFPSALSRMDTSLSPRSQLNSDMLVVAALEQRGSLFASLLEHIAMYLNDQSKELDHAEQRGKAPTVMLGTSATPASAVRRPRPSDGASDTDTTSKRPCVPTYQDAPRLQRDPRLRHREARPDATASPVVPSAAPPSALISAQLAVLGDQQTPQTSTDSGQPAGVTTDAHPSAFSFADAQRAPSSSAHQPPTTTDTVTTVPKPRLPPLVAEVLPNWALHFKVLREKLGHAPNARPFGKGVRFSPSSIEEYRLIQSYLTDLGCREDISLFTYGLPSEVSKKVAIRGLPVDTNPDDIVEALAELGYIAEFVRPINARLGRPGCIFFAILKNTPNLLPGIYEVSELLDMPGVIVEAWRSKKGPAQCHRCQAFRHSSHGCHRRLACVRCGEEHAAKDCPQLREVAATCVNCGGAHPANHTSCPQFKSELRYRTREGATEPLCTSCPQIKSKNIYTKCKK